MANEPSMYLVYQMNLLKHSDNRIILKDLATYLLSFYKVPKRLRPLVLKEMEAMKLIRIKEHQIEIINCPKLEEEYQTVNRITRRRKQVDAIINTKKNFFDF